MEAIVGLVVAGLVLAFIAWGIVHSIRSREAGPRKPNPYMRVAVPLLVAGPFGAIYASSTSYVGALQEQGLRVGRSGAGAVGELFGVRGALFFLDGAAAVVFGCVRSLQRAERRDEESLAVVAERPEHPPTSPSSGAAPQAGQTRGPEASESTVRPSAVAASERAPAGATAGTRIRQDPAGQRPVRPVMRDPKGTVVKLGVRDGTPERQRRYIAKYEADGYAYIRTEE